MTTSKTIAALLGPDVRRDCRDGAGQPRCNADCHRGTVQEPDAHRPRRLCCIRARGRVVLRPISAYSDGQMLIRMPDSGPV